MANLESRTKPIRYNISDFLIPFKALRHLPEIFKEKDKVIKGAEILYSAFITGAQIMTYSRLYQLISASLHYN